MYEYKKIQTYFQIPQNCIFLNKQKTFKQVNLDTHNNRAWVCLLSVCQSWSRGAKRCNRATNGCVKFVLLM